MNDLRERTPSSGSSTSSLVTGSLAFLFQFHVPHLLQAGLDLAEHGDELLSRASPFQGGNNARHRSGAGCELHIRVGTSFGQLDFNRLQVVQKRCHRTIQVGSSRTSRGAFKDVSRHDRTWNANTVSRLQILELR